MLAQTGRFTITDLCRAANSPPDGHSARRRASSLFCGAHYLIGVGSLISDRSRSVSTFLTWFIYASQDR